MKDKAPPAVHWLTCFGVRHSLFENLELSSFSGHTHSKGCPTSTADGRMPENAASKGSHFSPAQWLQLFPDLCGSSEQYVSNLSFQDLRPSVYFLGSNFRRQQRSRCAPAFAQRQRGVCWVQNPSYADALNHPGFGWWRGEIRLLGTSGSDCNNQIPFLYGKRQLRAPFS